MGIPEYRVGQFRGVGGLWNSVWKWFCRSQTGTLKAFPQALIGRSWTAGLIQMFDSTSIRAHVLAAGAKAGQKNQVLSRSRGSFGTKIHVTCALDGHPLDCHLTGNEASDSRQFHTLLEIGPEVIPRRVTADKGYDANADCAIARERGSVPVIPYRSHLPNPPRFFPKKLYKRRTRVEQSIEIETMQAGGNTIRED